jgi:hypothetical protein
LDSLVTFTKLNGSCLELHGFTTPEGYPFVMVVAVASPGNERAIQLAQDFAAKMRWLASRTEAAKR